MHVDLNTVSHICSIVTQVIGSASVLAVFLPHPYDDRAGKILTTTSKVINAVAANVDKLKK